MLRKQNALVTTQHPHRPFLVDIFRKRLCGAINSALYTMRIPTSSIEGILRSDNPPGTIASRSVYSIYIGNALTRQLHSKPIAASGSGHTRKQINSLTLSSTRKKIRLTAALSRMQLILHATRPTPNGALRSVQAMTAWSLKTRHAPSQHCRDTRVGVHTTAAMHDLDHTHLLPTPADQANVTRFPPSRFHSINRKTAHPTAPSKTPHSLGWGTTRRHFPTASPFSYVQHVRLSVCFHD